MSEAERQTKLTQLTLRRSKLSTEEAALLRELFHDIFEAYHEQVWNACGGASLRTTTPTADWAGILARLEHYREQKRRQREEASRKLAKKKARWEASMAPEGLKEIDFINALGTEDDR
jgi:predicted component of type VI protein secretion system